MHDPPADWGLDFDNAPTNNAEFEALVRRMLELLGEDPDGVQALDAAATPLVYEAPKASPDERDIWLVAERRDRDGEMETVQVDETPAPSA